MDNPTNILILGGTRDAIDLAILLDKSPRLNVVSSLAGRTLEPDRSFGKTRIGGFGGAIGLGKYLNEYRVNLVIDATHPFASTISKNAKLACEQSGVARVILERPKWKRDPGDDWWECKTLREAADKIPIDARAFLAMGHQHLSGFSHRKDCFFIARVMDPPESPLPLNNHEVVVAMPSDIVANELALFRQHRVTHLVCRNSGGTKAYAKIAAAREMKIPVIIVSRPPRIEGQVFASVEALNSHILS